MALFALQKALMTFVEEYQKLTGSDELSDKELLGAGVGFKQLCELTVEENSNRLKQGPVKDGSLRPAPPQAPVQRVTLTPHKPVTITPTGNNYSQAKGGNARRR